MNLKWNISHLSLLISSYRSSMNLFKYISSKNVLFYWLRKKWYNKKRINLFNDNSWNIELSEFVNRSFFVFITTTNMSQKKEECVPGDYIKIQVTVYTIFLQNNSTIRLVDFIFLYYEKSLQSTKIVTDQRKSVIPGDLFHILNQINRLYNLPAKEQLFSRPKKKNKMNE